MVESEGMISLLSVVTRLAAFTVVGSVQVMWAGGGVPLAVIVTRVSDVVFVSTVPARLAWPVSG